jgi:hypothetical protein
MDIQFIDEPGQGPRGRDEVRIKQIGLYVYEDLRRVAFGLELTPFLERPSIQVTIVNGAGEPAGSLSVIETMTPNFSLTLHLRDGELIDPYELMTVVYYSAPDSDRQDVDRQTISFSATVPGEQIFSFS